MRELEESWKKQLSVAAENAKKVKTEYLSYRKAVTLELRVKDELIERLQDIITKQMDEMKIMKTVISVPVLRNQLNQFSTKGVMYEDLMA